jgi:hypothetical protein
MTGALLLVEILGLVQKIYFLNFDQLNKSLTRSGESLKFILLE